MFRDFIKLRLGEDQAPQTTSHPLKLGRESVYLHCCFGHHVVVIEGYSFVAFCILDIIAEAIKLADCATAGWPRVGLN